MNKTHLIAALALLSCACSGSDEIGETRSAIAAFNPGDTPQTGHLVVAMANAPLSCASLSEALIVEGPGCDSPSWRVELAIPELLANEGTTVTLDTPDLFVSMGQQGGDCHSGEPQIDSGQLELVEIRQSEVVVDLQAITQSSVDPSGVYTAPLCR